MGRGCTKKDSWDTEKLKGNRRQEVQVIKEFDDSEFGTGMNEEIWESLQISPE